MSDNTIPGEDGTFVVTGFGVVHPWLCDAMGHLTTRHYLAFFDDATWHMLAELGYQAAAARAEEWGWADVRNEIDYTAEVAPGTLIRVLSRVSSLGRTSVTLASVMQDRETGAIAARMTAKLVCFDLAMRRAKPLPEGLRANAIARFGLTA